MNKTWVVAVREYKAAVCTKAFILSLALMPIFMGGGIFASVLLKGIKDLKERKFAVIDRTPDAKLVGILKDKVEKRNQKRMYDAKTGKQVEPAFVIEAVTPSASDAESILKQRFELSERVRKKEIVGFLEIGKDVVTLPKLSLAEMASAAAKAAIAAFDDDLADPKDSKDLFANLPDSIVTRYQTSNQMNMEFPSFAIGVVNQAVMEARAAAEKLPVTKVMALARPVPLVNKDLTSMNAQTGKVEEGKTANFLTTFLTPYMVMLLMFMIVMFAAQPLLQGVIEEKSQRIAEVLLGSATPFQIMAGKLLGVVGMSLTLAAVYLGGAYFTAQYMGYGEYLPAQLVGWFLVFLMIAVLMFGATFIAAGAACNDIKEAQTLMLPVMLVIVAPMMAFANIIKEPDGKLAIGLSLFPPATPLLMTVRQAIPPGVPLWQMLLGGAMSLLFTLFLLWAAGRIFRIGLLSQGKAPSLRELGRWILRG